MSDVAGSNNAEKSRSFRAVKTLAFGICGSGTPLAQAIDFDEVSRGTLDYIQRLPPIHRWGLWFFIWILEWSIWPMAPKWIPLSRLSRNNSEVYVASWQHNHFYFKQLLFKAVRSVILVQVFASPRVLEMVGFRGREACKE